ncbi:MAG: adenylyltransferase/cytidyltransferase family protein [Nanoarchaeota archaeon]|nr:adenylyltransferase/cytidyltransferase family protein [Nanoarchaeota archaeon]
MKVGLVHGRFQPFHNGHKFLVDKMLKECDAGVILIGSVGKKDKKNPFSLDERKEMIKKIYGKNKKLLVGANIDLDSPYSKNAQWDVVLSSCVLSIVGELPTKIYSGRDYSVPWERVKVKINKVKRYDDISGTDIKKLIYEKKFEEVKTLVPKEVFKIIKERF